MIAELAEVQHGVIARNQLRDLGLREAAIDRRIAGRRLHRIHYGVYAVGHKALTAEGRWIAAVLAGGPGAVLSHRSAAALWGLRPSGGPRIDITVPACGRRNRPEIVVHVTKELPDRDRAELAGIPVTSVARTILDLAGVVPSDQVARALEQAERMRVLDLRDLEGVCGRGQGRRGLGALLRGLADQMPPPPITRSELERLFVRFCTEHSIAQPQMNMFVCGHEVDAIWPARRLIVELDGYEYHRTRAAFERDRQRDAVLQLAGYRVVRLTHRRLRNQPDAVADMLRALLARGE